jgi:hypothetical protein
MYGQTLSWWERFLQRFQPTPMKLAHAELKQAELAELQAQSMAEYAALRVQIHKLTAEYHHNRIIRLKQFLYKNEEPAVQPNVAQFHPAY